MIVVPKDIQLKTSTTVALSFFEMTFGDDVADRVLSGFMAFSSLGNILVQTYTAARVKQEIAKEGILPFSKFFARNISLLGLGRKSKGDSAPSEATPVGALILHWFFSMLLILGSFDQTPDETYKLFVNLYSFTIDAFFGFCVGFGLLLWRLNEGRTHWSSKSKVSSLTSISAAAIFAIANFYPLVATWVPPDSAAWKDSIPWWVTGTVGFSLIALGGLYWVVLYYLIPYMRGKRLEVDKKPVFHNEHGYWVMWHEIVSFSWEVI
jgi:amino acid transporter